MLRRSLILIGMLMLVLGSFAAPFAYADSAAPGNAEIGTGAIEFAEPSAASLDSIHSNDTIFGVIENGKTTIALRVCGQGPHIQMRSEHIGSWISEIFYRTDLSNGCSPSPTSWWKMVINANAGTGERFRIYASAYENRLSDADFMERARRYICTIPSPGQVSCDAEAVTAPRIEIDDPANGSTIQGVVTARGWVVDKASTDGTGVTEVQMRVNGTFLGTATYGESRPDVATHLGDTRFTASQYRRSFDTSSIPNGSVTLQISYRIYRTLNYTIQGVARTTTIDQWHSADRLVTLNNPGYPLTVYNAPNYSSTWCYADSPKSANIYTTCNDQISSIQLRPGWSVRLYRDANQGGSSVCLVGSDADLSNNTFEDGSPLDNAISSFELFNQANCPPARQPTYALEVYSGANFTSNWCYSNAPTSANIHSTCNDRISSILLRSGWSVRLYRDENQTGPSVCMVGSDADLSNNVFEDGSLLNDAISSFTLYNQSNCPPIAKVPTYPFEVYTDIGYAGGYCYATGSKTANIHASCAGQISSLLLAPGWSVRLYQGVDQTGPSVCMNSSDSNLTDNHFDGGAPLNDAIRSFSLYAQSNCPSTQPAPPPVAQRVVISSDQGFDTCAAPSEATMRAWLNSPYDFIGIYIGGSARACRQPNLNATWVSRVGQQGWDFVPIWVGPQAPCSGFGSRFSSDPATARVEGAREADAAVAAAKRLGLTSADGTGSIIYYDMENFNTSNSSCKAAVTAFIGGWTQRLHELGNQSGAYGSACGSSVAQWATANPAPDAVWIASWFQGYYRPNVSTFKLSCVSDSLWSNNQRIRQYLGGHNEKWGNVTINIDSNKATGPVVAVSGSQTALQSSTQLQSTLDTAYVTSSGRTVADIGLVNNTEGWAIIDQQLYWTATRGVDWRNITPPITGLTIHTATFITPTHGWLTAIVPVTNGTAVVLLETNDAGKSWSQQLLPAVMMDATPVLPAMSHVHFFDAMNGWIVYQLPTGTNFSMGTLLRTRDGGDTWTQFQLPIAAPVRFISADVGWIAGGVDGGSLYVTRDGGASWTPQAPIIQSEMTEYASYQLPTFTSAQEGFLPVILSQPDQTRVAIYKTTDVGQTWVLHNERTLSGMVEQGTSVPVAVLSATNQIVADPAGVESLPAGVTKFAFVSAQSGWAMGMSQVCVAGSGSCTLQSELYATVDGGKTWSPLAMPAFKVYLPILVR
ncbi:glycoside hydrolase domain-containing protein [Candidatus Oscillochloris fontis]|uniref:glycoside hydrolase domain-containing protein n=1 Tax=Candidatus Oscillochloris fontis TaxID=2496868 RepID=UPI00101B5B06|nr:glycoside hydrolase domain-containing protein [Candidatus Oscillochloris fontis]